MVERILRSVATGVAAADSEAPLSGSRSVAEWGAGKRAAPRDPYPPRPTP